jgi:hypothetical protein
MLRCSVDVLKPVSDLPRRLHMAQRRAQDESDAIRHIVGRLSRQFPELPAEDVERAVYRKYESFTDSPIRDFVPVLVERAARRRLAEQRVRA